MAYNLLPFLCKTFIVSQLLGYQQIFFQENGITNNWSHVDAQFCNVNVSLFEQAVLKYVVNKDIP